MEAEVTGLIVARACPPTTNRCARPVPIGVSTGHPNITAGTIGARVTDGSGVFALSNNHVYADGNNASIGNNVLQPGAINGGVDPADAIGTLYAFEPIDFSGGNNTMDAAIALSSLGNLGNATLSDAYGSPSSTTVLAFEGQAVQKYGRTTGQTHGSVSAINITVDVCYEVFIIFCIKMARFVDQISIAGTPTTGDFSAGGDSGSLIVSDDSNKNPVGLLFVGSSTSTFADRIDLVLTDFGVTIDGGAAVRTDPPVITSPAIATATEDVLYTYDVAASDPDMGDTLAFSLDVFPRRHDHNR